MDVKEGDKVLYSKFAGTEVKVEGVEYLVLSPARPPGNRQLTQEE
jgi:co-chaperonin GroES (HSP10)